VRNWLLALVFLNLAFFAYTRLVGGSGATPPVTEPAAAVPRLHLVDEPRNRAVQRCSSVGTFAARSLAERALAQLAAPTRIPQLRATELTDPPLYSVSLTTSSLQPAISIARRLRAAGVLDLDVVPPKAGATQALVSFGSFSDPDNAARRVAELRRHAVNAAIVEQTRVRTVWWVDIERDQGDAPIDTAAIGAALQVGAGLVEEPCPEATPARPASVSPAPGGTAPATSPVTAGSAAAPATIRTGPSGGAPATAPVGTPAASPAAAPAAASGPKPAAAPAPVGGAQKPTAGAAPATPNRRALG
jgi:hypothetical protein